MATKKKVVTESDIKKSAGGGALAGVTREGQTIIHKNGTLGGYLVGKLHKESGIKAKIKDSGEVIEMQGNEVVITAPAVGNKLHDFDGKKMTQRQILSAINVEGGGVSFAQGGPIPKKINATGKTYMYGGKMVPDTEIVHSCGCQHHTFKNGGKLSDLKKNILVAKADDLVKVYHASTLKLSSIKPSNGKNFKFSEKGYVHVAIHPENAIGYVRFLDKEPYLYEITIHKKELLPDLGYIKTFGGKKTLEDSINLYGLARIKREIYGNEINLIEVPIIDNDVELKENYASGGNISSSTLAELDKAKKELAEGEKLQDLMKKANSIIKAKKDVTKRLIEIGLTEAQALKLQQPDFGGRTGFPSYRLTNNNANNKRLRDRVNMLSQKVEASNKAANTDEGQRYDFDKAPGGYIEVNYPEDRVQIFTNGKPEGELYTSLKGNGWHWSYTNKAWQRKITPQAISNALYITGAKKPESAPASTVADKNYSIEDIIARNFSYVTVSFYKAVADNFRGSEGVNILYFGTNSDEIKATVKKYVLDNINLQNPEALRVSVYVGTYVNEAKALLNEGKFLPNKNPDPSKILYPIFTQVKNFEALNVAEKGQGFKASIKDILTFEQFRNQYPAIFSSTEDGKEVSSLPIDFEDGTYHAFYTDQQTTFGAYKDIYVQYVKYIKALNPVSDENKPASSEQAKPAKPVFKNMGDYRQWIEEKTGKKILEFTEAEIETYLNELTSDQLVGEGTKKNRAAKAAQMIVYYGAKAADEEDLTLEQYATKKFIGGAITEAMVYTQPLTVFPEQYRKEWERVTGKAEAVIPQKTEIEQDAFNPAIKSAKDFALLSPEEIIALEIYKAYKAPFRVDNIADTIEDGGRWKKSTKDRVAKIIENLKKYGFITLQNALAPYGLMALQDAKAYFELPRFISTSSSGGKEWIDKVNAKKGNVAPAAFTGHKYKVGDYVKYIVGDVDKETWYGIITKLVEGLDAYRVTAFNVDYKQMDTDKTNELYEAQLMPISKETYDIHFETWKKNLEPDFKEPENKLPTRLQLMETIHPLDLDVLFIDNNGKERLMRKFQFSKEQSANHRIVTDLGIKESMTDRKDGGLDAIISYPLSMEKQVEQAFRELTKIKTVIPYEEPVKKSEPILDEKNHDFKISEKKELENEFNLLPLGVKILSTLSKGYNQSYTLTDVEGYKIMIGDKDGLPLQDGGNILSASTIMFVFGNELKSQLGTYPSLFIYGEKWSVPKEYGALILNALKNAGFTITKENKNNIVIKKDFGKEMYVGDNGGELNLSSYYGNEHISNIPYSIDFGNVSPVVLVKRIMYDYDQFSNKSKPVYSDQVNDPERWVKDETDTVSIKLYNHIMDLKSLLENDEKNNIPVPVKVISEEIIEPNSQNENELDIDITYNAEKGRQLMFVYGANEEMIRKKFDLVSSSLDGANGNLHINFKNGSGILHLTRGAVPGSYNSSVYAILKDIQQYLLNLADNYVYKLTDEQQKALFRLYLKPDSFVLLPQAYFDVNLKELETKSLLYSTANYPNVEVRFTENGKKFISRYQFETKNQFTGLLVEIKPALTEKPTTIQGKYKNAYELNKAIEAFLDQITEETALTAEQKVFISYYSGYGGLDKFGATGKGILYEYYTPAMVIKKMWGLAYEYGYKGGKWNEPSLGTGEFLKYSPDSGELCTGYEINPYSYKIAKILYPKANIKLAGFETQFIKNRSSIKDKIDGLPKFDLMIGNPPYGAIGSIEFGMGENKYTKAENWIDYFIFRGLDLLNKSGLLIFIIGTEVATGGLPWLQKPMTAIKKEIAEKADLLDAYRLPNGIFERTDVLSDIIVLRKK